MVVVVVVVGRLVVVVVVVVGSPVVVGKPVVVVVVVAGTFVVDALTQAPFWQVPLEQTRPQRPQFARSVLKFTAVVVPQIPELQTAE
mgnify:CR=1 FL=1